MAEESVSDGDEFIPKIVEVMSIPSHSKGVSNKILLDAIPSMTAKALVACLNKLIAQGNVELLKKGNQLVYKLKDSSAQKYQGSDIKEKVVFDAVQKAGNDGISTRDLGVKCHLDGRIISKILKTLQDKKLVKSFNISSRKKLYLLYELKPSQAATGGTFYNEGDFESEFVEVLSKMCYTYLVNAAAVAEKISDPVAQRNESFKSLQNICDYINNSKISKVNLSVKDIEKILDSLIYDDKLEKFVSMSKTGSSTDSGFENLYRVSKQLILSSGFAMVPCGVCAIHKQCHPSGDVTPATCVYMKEWLDF